MGHFGTSGPPKRHKKALFGPLRASKQGAQEVPKGVYMGAMYAMKCTPLEMGPGACLTLKLLGRVHQIVFGYGNDRIYGHKGP